MNKESLRPSTFTVVFYLLAIILLGVTLFIAVQSYTFGKGVIESGSSLSENGAATDLIGYILGTIMLPFSMSILCFGLANINQRMDIQHREFMYYLRNDHKKKR